MSKENKDFYSLLTRHLSEEEKDVVDKLSETLMNYKVPKSKQDVKHISVRKEKLSEYNLVVFYTCRICKTEYVQIFHMQWSVEQAGLISIKIDKEVENLKTNTRRISLPDCKSCRSFLLKQDKEYLIDLILRK